MKRLFATIIFLLFAYTGFSQKIYFSDTSNVWRVFGSTCGLSPYSEWFNTYQFGGDTVLTGIVYQKVYYPYISNTPGFFIREDTIQKKVYIKTYSNQFVDTNEMVLYNYNLQQGDTMRVNWLNLHATYHVQSIDSTLIGGRYYKIWTMKNDSFGMPGNNNPYNYATQEYKVVEGIGCLKDPQYPIYPYFFEGCEWLTCFHNNGQALPLSAKIDQFDNATSCTFTDVKETTLPNTVSVYPNPANTTSAIELKQPIQQGQLNVYDMLGRIVYHAAINNELKIPIGKNLPTPGQYFYRITDIDKSQSYTGKFIFE